TLLGYAAPRRRIARRRLHGPRHHRRRVSPLSGQPAYRLLDPGFPDLRQRLEGGSRRHLRAGAAGGEGRPAAIRLEARFLYPPIPHAQVETREVHALLVLVLTYPVGLPHHARVPRIAEMIDQG